MKIEDMTHTAWRCRRSLFVTKKAGMQCPWQHKEGCDDKKCAGCEHWQPSEVAEDFFKGKLRGTLATTIATIMLDRQKRGTF